MKLTPKPSADLSDVTLQMKITTQYQLMIPIGQSKAIYAEAQKPKTFRIFWTHCANTLLTTNKCVFTSHNKPKRT